MVTKVATDLDFSQNQALNLVEHSLSSAPATPKEGQRYYNTTSKKSYYWNGSAWIEGTSIATDAQATAGTATDVAINPKQLKAGLDGKQASLGYTAENTANKVTSFSSPTDTQYPSAKLVNDALANKAPLASPTFTGSPNAPTPTAGDNSTQIATTEFVAGAINTAVSGALLYRGTWDTTNASNFSGLNSYRPIYRGNLFRCSGTGCIIDGVDYKAGDVIIFNQDVSASTEITSVKLDKYDHTQSEDTVLLDAAQTLKNKTISATDNTLTNIDKANLKSGFVQTSVRNAANATDNNIVTEKAIRTELDLKAPLASPAFTGTPTAPTANAGTNSTQVATTAFVATAVSNGVSNRVKKEVFQNPTLAPNDGVCTWSITHTLNTTDIICMVYEVSTGKAVIMDNIVASATAYTIKFNAAASVAANTYKAVLIGV